jgi:hypothetical protein
MRHVLRLLGGLPMRRSLFRAAVLFGLLIATTLLAQQPGVILPQPKLNTVFPMGAKVGTAVEVTVTGADLDEVTGLAFSHPGIKADLVVPTSPTPDPKMKDKTQPGMKKGGPVTSAKFKVTVASDVPAGNHDVRVINKFGVSNPRAFVVGEKTEVLESDKAHNDLPDAQRIDIGSTVNAVIANQTDVDYYVFKGKANDRVIISCLTSSIDSRARPQLEVYDSTNRKLGLNRNYKENDALVDVTLPTEGDYYIRVAEFAYLAATADYFYRLSVSTAPWIDAVFPPAIPVGKASTVTVYGRNLPGGKPVPGVTLDGRPVESVSVSVTPPNDPNAHTKLAYRGYTSPARALQDGFEYQLTGPGGKSNNVTIYLTGLPVVLEKDANNDKPETAEEIALPVEVAGRIDKRYDKDWFSFTAKKGDVYYFELIAERLGSEMDTFFVVKNASNMGNVVEEQDDDPEPLHPISFFNRNGDPPAAKFTAPADGKYLVMVGSRESNVNFGPRCGYRLKIGKPAPDFRAVVMGKSRDVPISPLAYQGGEVALDVFVHRIDGYTGPIAATVEKLPPGVTAKPALIGTGSKWGTVVLTADVSAAPFTGPITVKCSATIDGKTVNQEARPATITWGVQPGQNIPTIARLDQSLYLAVRPEKAQLRIAADLATAKVKTKDRDGKDTEIPATFPLYVKPGDKITLPVKVTWQGEGARPNPVTVAVEPTQQNMQNAPVGLQAPVPIPKEKTDAPVTLDVRTTATPGSYSVVFRGDTQIQYARDPNKKDAKTPFTVTGFTAPLEVIVLPSTLGKVTVTPPLSAIKVGQSGELTVKVERAADYKGEYKVNVILPKDTKGVTVKEVVIPAGADEVKLPVAVASDAKPGTLSNLTATAIGTVHGKFPISQEVKFNLQIAAAK